MATKRTEKQLNNYIDEMEAKLERLQEELDEAENVAAEATERLEKDTAGWALPRKWSEKGLPVPRMEMHWVRDNSYTLRCVYVMVYRHLVDREDRPEIIGTPMGQTTSNGGENRSFIERGDNGPCLITPFRDWAHACSDSLQLKLPLFITTEDDDVCQVDFKKKVDGVYQMTMTRRAGKAVK